MTPLRIEAYRGADPGDNPDPDDPSSKLSWVAEQSDFREIVPGVWIPHKSVKTIKTPGDMVAEFGSAIVRVSEITEFRLNDEASVTGRVNFPPGASITDTSLVLPLVVVTGLAFVLGGCIWALRRRKSNAVGR